MSRSILLPALLACLLPPRPVWGPVFVLCGLGLGATPAHATAVQTSMAQSTITQSKLHVSSAKLQPLAENQPLTLIVLFDNAEQPGQVTRLQHLSQAAQRAQKQDYPRWKQHVWQQFSDRAVQVQRDYVNLPLSAVQVSSSAGLQALLSQPGVAGVYENRVYHPTLQQSLPLIHQQQTQRLGYTGAGTMVAVLDTGANYTKDAFGNCTAPGVPASCKVAVAMDFGGDDFSLDDDSHGTNVSAIVLGVAPDTRIAALDVMLRRTGGANDAADTEILAAIDWCISHRQQYNIVAMNMSFGDGSEQKQKITEGPLVVAFAQARAINIVPVVAAGNDRNIRGLAYPAAIHGALTAGAVYDAEAGSQSWGRPLTCTDATTVPDQVACFSNSADYLDLLAPGPSTTAAGITMGGTSQAAPHVAGAVAVLRSIVPQAQPDTLRQLLRDSGVPVTDPKSGYTTPRLNLEAAAQQAVPHQWQTRPALQQNRSQHSATTLAQGHVLVAGGSDGNTILSSVERYDASTQQWQSLPSLQQARADHRAILLENGQVLVSGGANNTSGALNTVEIYDPTQNRWLSGPAMHHARAGHSLTRLASGDLLVAGGNDNLGPVASTEIYHPATQTWHDAGNLNEARSQHSATLLGNQRVIIAGGRNASGVLSSAEGYDPETERWQLTASMHTPRVAHSANHMLTGEVLVAGGSNGSTVLASSESYDPLLEQWLPQPDLHFARQNHAAVQTNNGGILLTGGSDGLGGALDQSETFYPGLLVWASAGVMDRHRSGHSASLLPNGRVLLSGGLQDQTNANSAEFQPLAARNPDVVVEFYSPELKHYFMTASAAQQSLVDSGTAGRWLRTEGRFNTGGPNPVCRFYGTEYGPNSHFYSAVASDCELLISLYNPQAKSWKFEAYDFNTTAPVQGQCPYGLIPIYRAYNRGFEQGIDSNHRFTADRAAYQWTQAQGWLGEGAVMCAP